MTLGIYNFKLDDSRTTPIHVLEHKGREVWIAQEIGTALGYEEARFFTSKVNSDWADRFRPGKDIFKVEGEDLDTLKRLCGESPQSGADPIIHPRTPSLLLLAESGVFLACALAKTEAGDRFRWWLADEVLPSIRRTGGYSAPQAKAQAPGQGELFQVHPLTPFSSPSSPSVALKCLNLLRAQGGITQQHHMRQLAQLASRITGLEVELSPLVAGDDLTEIEDGVARFLRERCADDPDAVTVVEDVYDAYQRWCAQRGYPTASPIHMGRLMGKFGYGVRGRHRIAKRQRRCVRGLRLLPATIDITRAN